MNIYFKGIWYKINDYMFYRGEAAKLAHLIESASLKRKYMTKNYEKIFI